MNQKDKSSPSSIKAPTIIVLTCTIIVAAIVYAVYLSNIANTLSVFEAHLILLLAFLLCLSVIVLIIVLLIASSIDAKSISTKLRIKHLTISGILVSSVSLILIYDILMIGGNIAFYSKWIECGNKPLSVGISVKGPEFYEESAPVSLARFDNRFFCTPRDAERSGFSSSEDRYSFPNLSKEEARQVMNNKFGFTFD